MNILVIGINYSPEPTGISPYTTALSRRLADQGHDVQVITAFPHYPEWAFAGRPPRTQDEVIDGVKVRRLRHRLPAVPSGVTRLLSEISFGLRAITTSWGEPDQIIVASPALFASALVVLRARLRRHKAPVMVWVQDLYSRGLEELHGGSGRAPLALRVIKAVEGWTMRTADRVTVIHDSFADTVRAFDVESESISVIRNWSHLGATETPDRAAVRHQLGWRDDEVIVLHAGNMGVKQHLGNVIDAARTLRPTDRIRFVLMGDGSERRELQRLAADVPGISFVEPLPDDEYVAALHAADVLLVNEAPGLRNMALPSKLTSYFFTGRPVVAATHTDSLSARELRAAGAGVVVDPSDPTAIVDAARALQDDPAHAARLGTNGLAYCRERLSEDAAITAFAALLPRRAEQTADTWHLRHPRAAAAAELVSVDTAAMSLEIR